MTNTHHRDTATAMWEEATYEYLDRRYGQVAVERGEDPDRFVSENEMTNMSDLDQEGAWWDEMADRLHKDRMGE